MEGTVTDVRPGPGPGQEGVTLQVSRAYKSDTGPADLTFTINRAQPESRTPTCR